MNAIRIFFLLLALISFGGCAEVNKEMASWVGHDQNELIARWGPPQQVLDDGNGGKILVFTQTRSFTSPGTATTTVNGSIYGSGYNATANTTYSPPTTTSYNAARMFWVNSSGIVYRWAWRGL